MNKGPVLFLPLLFLFVSCLGSGFTNLEISGISEGVTEGKIIRVSESDNRLSLLFRTESEEEGEILVSPGPGGIKFFAEPDRIVSEMRFTPAGPEKRISLYRRESLAGLITERGGSLFFPEKGARFIPGDPVPPERIPENATPAGRTAVDLLLERAGSDPIHLERGKPHTLTLGEETWRILVLLATVPDREKEEKSSFAYEGQPLEIDWIGIRIK